MRAALVIAALALSACTVDASFLDRRLFTCGADADCGPGWGCARATPYTSDFCAQRCDSTTCDGVCSQGLCLHGCHISPDGSSSPCASADYQCIRLHASDANGVCYPVHACTHTSDCGANEFCVSEIFAGATGDVPAGYDDFYCIPRETDATMCPAGSYRILIRDTDMHGVCFAECSAMDRRCPPAFGCVYQYQGISGASMSPCLPGTYGIPCEDDTNCIDGHCRDAGTGKYCTVSCEEAGVLHGGTTPCGSLVARTGYNAFYTMTCNAAADGGMNGGLCDVRYEVGFPACSGDSSSPPGMGGHYICADGLQCMHLMGMGTMVDVCSKSCTSSADCNAAGGTRNYCATAAGNLCAPRGMVGDPCGAADGCLTGHCDLAMFKCVSP